MKRILVLFAAAALLCSCGPKLVILHVNDTHSHLDPVRTGSDAGRGGIIERAAFVDSVRQAVGENKVLLLHAGDWNQGSSYFSELGGSLEVEMVNAMRYDAIALGNHEFDNGIENLCERLSRLTVPVVCADLDLRDSELGKYVKPYIIIHKGGMKLGIIGLEAKLEGVVSKSISARIPQLDPVEVTNKWAKYLKEEEKCDMVILLSHQGYKPDVENAASIKGVDLVVGGHSHTFMDGFEWVEDLEGKSVPVIQDGCWGLDFGMITIR